MDNKNNSAQKDLIEEINNHENGTVNKNSIDKNTIDNHRTAAIMAAVNIESAFKLYSYRCIDHAPFQERMKELCETYLNQIS